MPETPLIASSIGSMTEVDISSGLAPGNVSATLTVAGAALGKRSTPRLRNETVPSTTSDMTSIVAKTGPRTQRSDSTRKLPDGVKERALKYTTRAKGRPAATSAGGRLAFPVD